MWNGKTDNHAQSILSGVSKCVRVNISIFHDFRTLDRLQTVKFNKSAGIIIIKRIQAKMKKKEKESR